MSEDPGYAEKDLPRPSIPQNSEKTYLTCRRRPDRRSCVANVSSWHGLSKTEVSESTRDESSPLILSHISTASGTHYSVGVRNFADHPGSWRCESRIVLRKSTA